MWNDTRLKRQPPQRTHQLRQLHDQIPQRQHDLGTVDRGMVRLIQLLFLAYLLVWFLWLVVIGTFGLGQLLLRGQFAHYPQLGQLCEFSSRKGYGTVVHRTLATNDKEQITYYSFYRCAQVVVHEVCVT